MKWFILQSGGQHEENKDFRECFAIKHGLEKNNQEAFIYGIRHPFQFRKDVDITFIAEQYEFDWIIPLLENNKTLKIQWIVDSHVNKEMYLDVMKYCDIILHANTHYIPFYTSYFPTKKHIWFPNCVDDRYFHSNYEKEFGSKINDFIFVGSQGSQRLFYLNYLKASIGLKCFEILGKEMLRLIYTSKIHFNKSSSIDLPYRIFETIGLGTCLVTDYNSDLEKLGFKDGINCLLYRNYLECYYKVKDALIYNKWEEIGTKGNLLAKEHTYTKRLKQIIKEIL